MSIEIENLKQETLNQIKQLQVDTQWWGDKKLNDIKTYIERIPSYEEDTLMMQVERFQNYKEEYLNKVSKF